MNHRPYRTPSRLIIFLVSQFHVETTPTWLTPGQKLWCNCSHQHNPHHCRRRKGESLYAKRGRPCYRARVCPMNLFSASLADYQHPFCCCCSIFVTLTSRLVLNLRMEHERSALAGYTTSRFASVGAGIGVGTGTAGMNFATRVFANFTVDMDCEEGSVYSDSEESYEMSDSITSRGSGSCQL